MVLIRDIAPYIGVRATPSLPRSTPLYFGASMLGKREMDSIAIVDRGNLVGELRFLDIIRYLFRLKDTSQTPLELHNVDIQQVMSRTPNVARTDDTLQHLLSLIKKSGSGVVFIIDNSHLIGSISLIDILCWLVHSELQIDKRPTDIASDNLVYAQADARVEEIVQLMFNHYVRRIFAQHDGKLIGLIDDRGLNNKIFGGNHDYRKFNEIFKQPISDYVEKVSVMKRDAPLVVVIRAILDSKTRCVLLDGEWVITPWDLVIKTLAHD